MFTYFYDAQLGHCVVREVGEGQGLPQGVGLWSKPGGARDALRRSGGRARVRHGAVVRWPEPPPEPTALVLGLQKKNPALEDGGVE